MLGEAFNDLVSPMSHEDFNASFGSMGMYMMM
jgi:hypothetical protein